VAGFFDVAYLAAFCLLMVIAYKENKLLKAKFGLNQGNPLWRFRVTVCTYAGSFLFRAIFNLYIVSNSAEIDEIQKNSCEDNTVGWALIVFFLHFLGEVFPLAVLFWMQIVLSRLKI